MQDIRNVIVIGASAGGINAIKEVIRDLPATIDAAVLVVVHMSRKSNSGNIAFEFQKYTDLTCSVAAHNMILQPGHLYVALADHHLMVKDGTIRVNQGPHENKYRPSIDVLFRSAAVSYGHRAIGIILTGMLEDGTSGMWALKQCGGLCIVQDPVEAEFASMPQSVINKMQADYIAGLDEIPPILLEIMSRPLPPRTEVPMEFRIEANITEKMMSDIDKLKEIADHSDFICPDCGGGLWEIKNDVQGRYRCHTGHVYTEALLNRLKDENIEESVWVSVRMLEEKVNLLMLAQKRDRLVKDEEEISWQSTRIKDLQEHIARLKALLVLLHKDLNPVGNDADPE